MSKIITFSGKGGVGKTTTTALLLDELARAGYRGRLLAVDGDPATTLYLALGLTPPTQTLADVRDGLQLDAKTLRGLPPGQTPAQFVARQLLAGQVLARQQLRRMEFDLLTLGWGEGRPGCYCSLNNALSQVLTHLWSQYDLIIIDNEAGLEHLSRYRLQAVDLFITVVTDHPASQIVGQRLEYVARSVGMRLAETVTVEINRGLSRYGAHGQTISLPFEPALGWLGQPVPTLNPHHPLRTAMRPLVARVLTLVGPPIMAAPVEA